MSWLPEQEHHVYESYQVYGIIDDGKASVDEKPDFLFVENGLEFSFKRFVDVVSHLLETEVFAAVCVREFRDGFYHLV